MGLSRRPSAPPQYGRWNRGRRGGVGQAMRTLFPLLPLLPVLLVAACDGGKQSADQPGVVANIMEEALPNTQQPAPPANAITPVEPPPAIDPPAAAPSGPVPATLQGGWTGMADRCGDRSADLELTIAPDRLLFHESVGEVRSVKATGSGLSVDAAFTGEGQSWTRTLLLKPSADGRTLTIVNDGAAVTRKRC